MNFMRHENANFSHSSQLFLSSPHKKHYSGRKQVILIVDIMTYTTPEPVVKAMHIKIQSEYPNYFLRSRKIIRSFLFVYCSQTLGCIYVFSSLNCTSMYCCCLVWTIQRKSQWLRSSKTFPKSVVFFHVQNYRNVHFFDQFLFNFYPVKISWHTNDWCVSS